MKNQPVFFIIATCILTMAGVSHARENGAVEDTGDSAVTDEIVATATRFAQKKSDVPNRMEVISAEDAKFYNPQTAADLVGKSGEVFVQKSQLGGGSPMIRGFSANRLLITIDGVRMNNAIYRSGNLQNVISLDPFALAQTEIIFGPGSIVYGSDAIGGVMAFRTLQPLFAEKGRVRFSGNALTRCASADREKTGHFDFSFGNRMLASLTSVTYSDFGDLRMGSRGHEEYTRPEYVIRVNGVDSVVRNENKNIQVGSGYDQINVMEKIRFRPAKNLHIENGFHYSTTSDIPRYDRLIQYRKGSLRYGDWYYGPQTWMMNALSAGYTGGCGLFDEANLIAAYQEYRESRHSRDRGNPVRLDQAELVKAGSLNADFTKSARHGGSILYGIESVFNRVISTGANADIVTGIHEAAASRYPDSRYLTAAGYLSYKHRFNPVWLVHAGARYNVVSMAGTFDTSLIHLPYDRIELATRALNGGIGAICVPTNGLRLSATLSSGFRAPNVDDMGKLFDPAPGTVIVPNDRLGPEYAYCADAGMNASLGGLLAAGANAFFMRLDGAMVRRAAVFNGQDTIIYNGDTCRVLSIVNSDRAYSYGASASLSIRPLPWLSFEARAALTKGRERDETTGGYCSLRHAAPFQAGGGIVFRKNKLRAELYGIHNAEIPYRDLAPSERDKPYLYAADAGGNPYCPDWHTINLKAAYLLSGRLSLSGGIENILDTRYRPYSSGIVAAGRNYIVALRGKL